MKSTLTICALLIATLSYSQSKKTEKSFSNEIETSVSVTEAWQLVTDVSKWKTWDSHIIDARQKGEFTRKTKGTLVTSYATVEQFAVVEFIENESYTIRHKISSGVLFLKRSVLAADLGSKIKTEVWFTGLSVKNFEKYMGGNYENALANELVNVKQLLEKEGLASNKM